MKILFTGGYGFLGKKVISLFEKSGNEIFAFRSKDYDLRDEIEVKKLFKAFHPEVVVHMAARLGGIGDNQNNPTDYFEDNMKMGMNVFKESASFNVKKIINVGTVCSYPKNTNVPFKEEDLWNGFPEDTNAAYGVSKRALITYADSLNKKTGLNTITLLMTNLYGDGDDFRDKTSHVIPALIRKINDAIETGSDSINVWGDGTPTRDFIHVDDAAKSVLATFNRDIDGPKIGPINIGSGKEISIREIVEMITSIMNYDKKVCYDSSKPNGQTRRLLCTEKAAKHLNFKSEIEIKDGLESVVDYFNQNKNEILSMGDKYKQS